VKTIGNFQTEDPLRLSEQLDRFQANIVAETNAIRIASMPNLRPAALSFTQLEAFSVGQIAIVDTSLGNVTITLGKPDVPGFAAVAKQVAANSVIITPAGRTALGQILINQALSKAYAAAGLYWLFFDGLNWEAAP
jgi:hypothetical protein